MFNSCRNICDKKRPRNCAASGFQLCGNKVVAKPFRALRLCAWEGFETPPGQPPAFRYAARECGVRAYCGLKDEVSNHKGAFADKFQLLSGFFISCILGRLFHHLQTHSQLVIARKLFLAFILLVLLAFSVLAERPFSR